MGRDLPRKVGIPSLGVRLRSGVVVGPPRIPRPLAGAQASEGWLRFPLEWDGVVAKSDGDLIRGAASLGDR